MNFFRNRSLKQLSIIVAFAFFCLIILEIFWIQNRASRNETIQYQIDFVRTVQVTNERLSSRINQVIQGSSFSADIHSLVKQQELNLKLIESGGRVPGSDVFLPKLQRLPKITYGNLQELWTTYKNQIQELSTQT